MKQNEQSKSRNVLKQFLWFSLQACHVLSTAGTTPGSHPVVRSSPAINLGRGAARMYANISIGTSPHSSPFVALPSKSMKRWVSCDVVRRDRVGMEVGWMHMGIGFGYRLKGNLLLNTCHYLGGGDTIYTSLGLEGAYIIVIV